MKKTILLLLALISFYTTYSQNSYVFFGSYTPDKNAEGIYVYQLDTIKGKLTKITSINNISNPSYLSLSNDGKFLYACTESRTPNAGSVSSFKFDPQNKSLTFLNSQKTNGENPAYLSIDHTGKWLVDANYTGSSISVFPIAEDGKIDPIVQYIPFTEGSINPERQKSSHVHSVFFSPDNNYIISPDLGADKIRIFPFDSYKKEPLDTSNSSFVKSIPGSGPRHFAFHPNKKWSYSIEEIAGAISAYSFEKGQLNLIDRIKIQSKKETKDFGSAEILISPDGKFLYVSNRGIENNISIYSIEKDGSLKNVSTQSSLGNHPRNFAIDPSGKFLIVANMNSQSIIVFKRNQQTGLLKKVSKLKLKNISCVKIKTM
ncbi:lactonase family protein [Flavobacterium sufflavum]|uniref:Lactonase family protein n=1 Tax=Flavobacterium sufflavum TaxID=1921138 RepID=A0A437KYY7_9FLAO|nr:lactonase family protein [Flavobacterium sufflavum]RVT77649.1 lactonase family protein [Flavobacterium sufflavum]